ncbi:phosphatidylinositol-glycan biosynthesis class S protein [Cunninghamella echinulata]|nr:phosphatidylinositol-glycan biosynthesis class S protein [Cunninghamella echinulata]
MRDSTQLVVLAFWCVVLLGVPFWWKTTEVYRARLPFNDIDSWKERHDSTFILPTTINLYVPEELSHPDSKINIEDLSTYLENQLSKEFKNVSPCVTFPIHIQVNPWSTADITKDNLDTILQKHSDAPVGQYFLYLHSSNIIVSKSKQESVNAIIGNSRSSVIQLREIKEDDIKTLILSLVPAIFKPEFTALGDIACPSVNVDKYDANSMRTFKYSSRYQVTISLMNDNPKSLAVDWDIRGAVKSYLYPLLKELSDVSNFTVDSQIQNYAPLSQTPRYMERIGKPDYFYFTPEQLPHFVNSADWNLASSISSYPTINFILYIPSDNVTPLRIHDSHGKPLLSNSFLIPRWGGVTIKNPPKNVTSGSHYSMTKTDLQPIMKIFISQLRSLVGVQDVKSSSALHLLLSTHSGITTLEKDNLVRRRIMENIINSISTLHSLSQLVLEIPNMVVLDHIQYQVRESLESIQSARDELENGNYGKALKHSIDAIELSEKAFFDPTMVSMLYFPDEHKYAIYMPLFVPISVPLCMALIKTLKKRRSSSLPLSEEAKNK